MSDVDGAAPAAAAPAAAPEAEVAPPAPISTEGNPASAEDAKVATDKAAQDKAAADKAAAKVKADAEKKPVTTRDALKKAAEKVAADEKAKALAEKDDPKAKVETDPKKEPQPRSETGQFAGKDKTTEQPAGEKPATEAKPTNFVEAPQRFSPDAKTAWKDAPEPVRAEIHRAVKELEHGYSKHKADAEAFGELKPYADLAQKSGTTLKAAMSAYVGMEQKLRTDFIGGLEQLCQNRGITLRGLAARIMGQKPEEAASRQDQTIGALQREIAGLKQQLGGVAKSIETQRSESTMSQVAAFAAQSGHERFEELAADIKFFLDSGRTADLKEAYQLAERLNPAAAKPTTQPASAPATEAVTAQNRAGQKSITGAPAGGSAPPKATSPTTRKALERAFAAAGR